MAQNSDGSAKPPRGPGRPFPKGTTGNPGGRPKMPPELAEALRSRNMKSVEVLSKVQDDFLRGLYVDEKGGVHEAPKASEAIKASEVLLAYSIGKPRESVELTGEDGGPINVTRLDRAKLTKDEIAAAIVVQRARLRQQQAEATDAEAEESEG